MIRRETQGLRGPWLAAAAAAAVGAVAATAVAVGVTASAALVAAAVTEFVQEPFPRLPWNPKVLNSGLSYLDRLA